MEIVMVDAPPPVAWVPARDGQKFMTKAGVVRYHACLDLKKAIGDDLRCTSGGNYFVHRFSTYAGSSDVAVILALAEAVIAIHQEAHTTKRGVRNMAVPEGKQLRFRAADGSVHGSIDGAIRADIHLACEDAIAKLTPNSAKAMAGVWEHAPFGSDIIAPAKLHLSALFNALSVKQLSRVVSALTTFKIELDAAS